MIALCEIHGLTVTEKKMRILVADDGRFVRLSVGEIAWAQLTPGEARFIARELAHAADRTERKDDGDA